MLGFGKDDASIASEAKEIARKSTNDPTLQKYIEGASFKIIKLEDKLERLTLNFWMLVFIIFILPIFVR